MSEKKKKDHDFAGRMKKLRKKCGRSIEELAAVTGYDSEYLEKVESGEVRPPVSAIIKISSSLDVDSGAFLSAEKDTVKQKAESIDKRKKAYSYKSLSPEAQLKHMKAFQVTIDPEKEHEGVEFSHDGEEFIHVLEGRLEITVATKKHSMKAGQSIHFDSKMVHRLMNPGKKKTELLVVVYTP